MLHWKSHTLSKTTSEMQVFQSTIPYICDQLHDTVLQIDLSNRDMLFQRNLATKMHKVNRTTLEAFSSEEISWIPMLKLCW